MSHDTTLFAKSKPKTRNSFPECADPTHKSFAFSWFHGYDQDHLFAQISKFAGDL